MPGLPERRANFVTREITVSPAEMQPWNGRLPTETKSMAVRSGRRSSPIHCPQGRRGDGARKRMAEGDGGDGVRFRHTLWPVWHDK